jgi:hypothetical protein
MTATLTHLKESSTLGSAVEVSSSWAEIELKEEKVYTHLDEEECDAGTWVLDTGATNHKSGCQAAFMKLDTALLNTMQFGDDSVVRIEGHETAMFV